MTDVLVFGSGKYYERVSVNIKENYNVLAILDNDTNKLNNIDNMIVVVFIPFHHCIENTVK